MLAIVGLSGADELFRSIPADVQLDRQLNVTEPLAESEVIAEMERMAAKNTAATKPSFLGAGVYSHFSPTIVDHLIQRSEFFTRLTRRISPRYRRARCNTSLSFRHWSAS